MNLYTTSDNTRACVSALDDYLLGRTIVEAAQMISTAINLNDKIKDKPEGLYANYNANEEHNVWVRESKYNFKWTFMYLLDALNEFRARTGKPHKCWKIAQVSGMLDVYFPDVPMTPFPRKFKKELPEYDKLMNIKDTCEAYREYLKLRWMENTKDGRPPHWTRTAPPEFFIGSSVEQAEEEGRM